MSAIHRVDDDDQLPGPRYMALAWRLGGYPGWIAHHQAAEARRKARDRPRTLADWVQRNPDAMARAVQTLESRTGGRPDAGL